MSSTVKGLIAGIAALVVLGGGILAMKLTEPKPETQDTESSATEETAPEVYRFDYNNIKTFEVTNENEGYTLKRTYRAATEEEQSKFEVAGLENIKLDDTIMADFGPNAAVLTASMLIEENCADLSRFGLDKPRAQAVITLDGDDAQTITLLLGNDTPAGDIYVCLKGSDTVYSAPSSFIKTYLYEKEYFISKEILEEPDDENYPVVEKLTIERSDLDYDIVLEYAGENQSGGTVSTHMMTSPVNAYLNVSSSVDYTHGLFGLNASSVLSVSPSEEELAFSGLNEPACVVTMVLEDGKEYVLKIGKQYSGGAEDTSSGGYIGYFEGIDILWHFSEDAVPWINMKPEDAMSSLVFGSYIYDLKSLDIESEGGNAKFSFSGTSADTYSVMLNGKDFDFDRYKAFYQALIKAPAEEICLTDEGTGKKLASFELKYNNGSPDELIEFYEADNNRVIIKKNGITSFRCRMAFVEKALLPNIANIEGESDFVTNW